MNSYRCVFRNHLIPAIIKPFSVLPQFILFNQPELDKVALKMKIRSMKQSQITIQRKKMKNLNQAIIQYNLGIACKYISKISKAPFYYQILIKYHLKNYGLNQDSYLSQQAHNRLQIHKNTQSFQQRKTQQIINDFILRGKIQQISPFQRKICYQKFQNDYDKYVKKFQAGMIKLIPILYLRSPLQFFLAENPQLTTMDYQKSDKTVYQKKFDKLRTQYEIKMSKISIQENISIYNLLRMVKTQFNPKPKFTRVIFF